MEGVKEKIMEERIGVQKCLKKGVFKPKVTGRTANWEQEGWRFDSQPTCVGLLVVVFLMYPWMDG